jgi:hypothetical protein
MKKINSFFKCTRKSSVHPTKGKRSVAGGRQAGRQTGAAGKKCRYKPRDVHLVDGYLALLERSKALPPKIQSKGRS